VNDDTPIRLSGKKVIVPINADVKTYRIAFVSADGSFDIVREFFVHNDAEANQYAEDHYGDQDWYVLDARGNNINGGEA